MTDRQPAADRATQRPAPSLLSARLVTNGLWVAALALLTLVMASTAVDFWSTRTSLLQDSKVEASIVADNVSAALVFRDARTANEILAALRASPMVLGASVYDSDGMLFAHYGARPDEQTAQFLSLHHPAGQSAGWRTLEIAQPVESSAKVWGTLYVRKSMRPVYQRLLIRFLSVALIAACVMAAASAMVLHSRAMLREAEGRLHALAHTDAVTGLGNRHAFNEQLARAIEQARKSDARLALLYIDLDNFKTLNDTFGHAAGDDLLRYVGRRLQSLVRADDTAYRLGGDEFALIVRPGADDAQVETLGRRVVGMFRAPHADLQQPVNLTCSAGIATFPEDARDMDSLITSADTALYHAKELGKNLCVRFEASMDLQRTRRRAIEHALRRELERPAGGLELHYQPLFAAYDMRLVGAESLLRWTHADLGVISPLEAISVAEECGLIVPLGYWVMRTACRQAAQWQGRSPMRMAVNVSARQLGDPRFLERVMDILREQGLAAELLEIELTETVLMENVEAGVYILRRLSQLGIHLAIDDFGTGYSSLAYLRQLPMRRVKVDRSFVKDLPQQEHSRAIVNAIVALAHELGLQVTAEGVETQQQADYLVQQGCDVLQGYAFGRPMPAAQFSSFMEQGAAA